MMSIRRRLQSALWRVPLEQEVREELAHHVELRTEELISRGITPGDARRQALARLGDPAHMTDTLTRIGRRRDRTFARRQWWAELRQDVAFALRQGRRQPGFTLAAVLTLALGLGSTTAIYSIVHAVLLKPFPFAEPDRVLRVYTSWRGNLGSTSVGNYEYIRLRAQTIEQLAASGSFAVNLSDDGLPERVQGARVTWNYFGVFGASALHGRVFTQDEDSPGQNRVLVLSHRLWQRRFGGDMRVIGRQVRLSGETYDVIGIMPPSFSEIVERDELWAPIAFTPQQLALHDEHFLQMYGLRRTDATMAQVNDELTRIAESLTAEFPRHNLERGASATAFDVSVIGSYRTRLYVLLGAVLIVLLTACGNVANLLLARLAARSRELAIRAAIGAGRWRIVRQVMTESLVLAGMGGIAGVLAAYWALPLLIARAPAGVPRISSASLDLPVIGAALLLVVTTAILVGFLPALQATRGDLNHELGDGKGGSGRMLRPWIRQALIAAQAAMVVIVLAGAALLIRSAVKLQQVPIGFDMSGVLTNRVALPSSQYRSPAIVRATFDDLQRRLQSAPGVAAVGIDSQPPLMGANGSNGILPEGREYDLRNMVPSQSHFISPGYFTALRIPVLAGRAFTDADVRSAPLVMIINQTLARATFGDADPVGKRMSCCEFGPDGPGTPSWKIVVGVVPDVRTRGPGLPPQPEFYLPLAQIPDVAWSWINNSLNLIVRARDGHPAALASVVRDAVRDVDPSLPVYGVSTMEEGLARTTAQARFNTTLMTALGGTALLLAALGVYSVIAWLVAQRTREIGLRMALGASARDVVRQMTLHGLRPVAAGLGIGLAGALAAGRVLEGQLFETGPRDPVAIGSVVVLLFVVAAFASMVPAWRASAVDPSKALREG